MTSKLINHSLITRLAACALLAACFAAAAFAPPPTAAQQPAPKVNLTSESNAVRFELQGEARTWQLEVFSLSGDLLYTSGGVHNQKFEWKLQDQHGEPLASGPYAYTLRFLDERHETAATQRGYFVVDGSGAGNHVWMASDGAGAASELTVAGAPRGAAEQEQPPIIQACASVCTDSQMIIGCDERSQKPANVNGASTSPWRHVGRMNNGCTGDADRLAVGAHRRSLRQQRRRGAHWLFASPVWRRPMQSPVRDGLRQPRLRPTSFRGDQFTD